MPTVANITINGTEGQPSMAIVNVSGELDESNLPEFENAVGSIKSNREIKTIIFCFNGLNFMSSKIIGFLAATYTTLSRDRRKMAFAECNDTILDILTLVGLDQLAPNYKSINEALSAT